MDLVVTVAFHQDGLFRLPPVSVPAPTIAEWIAAPTSIAVVVVADAASSSATVSETGKAPGAGNLNDGDGAVEVPALPNVYIRDTTSPSLSVLRSRKSHVRSTHDQSNAAAGAAFGAGAATASVAASVSESPLA